MTNRLIAFGCSHTYGHGLPDCYSPSNNMPGPVPSKFAWPEILKNKLNYNQCLNQGQCAASNIEILNKLVLFEYTESDIVVVLWSYSARDTIFHSDINSFLRINSSKKGVFENWAKLHNDYDLDIRTALCMNHAHTFLEKKKIKHFFFSVEDRFVQSVDILNRYRIVVNSIEFDKIVNSNPRALDGRHPGVEAQEKIAGCLKEKLIM